jgi:hypothetical protein
LLAEKSRASFGVRVDILGGVMAATSVLDRLLDESDASSPKFRPKIELIPSKSIKSGRREFNALFVEERGPIYCRELPANPFVSTGFRATVSDSDQVDNNLARLDFVEDISELRCAIPNHNDLGVR